MSNGMWMGRRVKDMTREELLEIVGWLIDDNRRQYKDMEQMLNSWRVCRELRLTAAELASMNSSRDWWQRLRDSLRGR